jgi:hypothetical protein
LLDVLLLKYTYETERQLVKDVCTPIGTAECS